MPVRRTNRRAMGVHEVHAASISLHFWTKAAAHSQMYEQPVASAPRTGANGEPVFKAARVVHEPFFQRVVPIVSHSFARGAHARFAGHGAFVPGETVAAEFQPP